MLIFKVQLQQNNDHQEQIGAKRLQQCQIDGGRRDLPINRLKYRRRRNRYTGDQTHTRKIQNTELEKYSKIFKILHQYPN